jgi:hypothetical protein
MFNNEDEFKDELYKDSLKKLINDGFVCKNCFVYHNSIMVKELIFVNGEDNVMFRCNFSIFYDYNKLHTKIHFDLPLQDVTRENNDLMLKINSKLESLNEGKLYSLSVKDPCLYTKICYHLCFVEDQLHKFDNSWVMLRGFHLRL